MATKVLLAGESWVTHSTHVKGFDSFTTSSYSEGGTELMTGPAEYVFSGALSLSQLGLSPISQAPSQLAPAGTR